MTTQWVEGANPAAAEECDRRNWKQRHALNMPNPRLAQHFHKLGRGQARLLGHPKLQFPGKLLETANGKFADRTP